VPEAAQAVADGDLSTDQADVITHHLADVEDVQARGEAAELLVRNAPQLAVCQLKQAAKAARAHLVAEEDGSEHASPETAVANEVTLTATGTSEEPFYVLHGTLNALTGEKLRRALEAATDTPTENDRRTAAERMGDALALLADLILGAEKLPTVTGVRPHLTIVADLDALTGQQTPRQEGAVQEELAGLLATPRAATTRGQELSPATLRQLACDSSLRSILTNGQDQPLSIGHRSRQIPGHLRDAVIARDRHCRWSDCHRPPEWTECHHIQHWADGGATSLDNLALFCEAHHRDLHHGGWKVVTTPGHGITVQPTDPDALPPNTRYAPTA
jgi:hypothetical protein